MFNLNVFFSILENAALLLALVYVYSISPTHQNKVTPVLWQLFMGALIGTIGVIIMMDPLVYRQDILFDARSVVLCLSGLFFGGIPTLIATIMMAIYRYNLGGVAVWIGIFSLSGSALIGLVWRRYRRHQLDQISYREFFIFGLIVHVIVLQWLFLLPFEQALQTISALALPIMMVLPLLTMIIGHLLAKIVFRGRDIQVKLQEDFLFNNQFDIGNIGISITTKTKYWLKVNPYLCRMFGYTENELKSLTWAELTHPDDLNKDLLLYEKMLKGELNEYEIDKRFMAKDGSVVYTHVTIACRRHVQDNTFLVIAGFLDITQQKQAEQALLQSKEQLALVLDSSELGVWDWDIQGNRISTNRYSADILGCSMDELNLHPERWINAIQQKDKFKFLRSINEIIKGRSISQRVEYQLTNIHGGSRWILQTGSVVDVDDKGKPLRMCGTHSDITDIKQVEDSLSIASSVYQNSSEAMSVFTAKGIIIDSNPAFSFITGFTKTDIQEQHLRMFETDLQPKHFYQQLAQQLNQQGHWHGEVWMRRKNGQNYLILLTINSIIRTKSQAARFVALFSDITEKKQTEELIWRQANYDALTGLPNRRMLLTFLNQEVLSSERQHDHFAL
ncbi:PAS domain S-box protein, partial [Shewanella livingstonensis]